VGEVTVLCMVVEEMDKDDGDAFVVGDKVWMQSTPLTTYPPTPTPTPTTAPTPTPTLTPTTHGQRKQLQCYSPSWSSLQPFQR